MSKFNERSSSQLTANLIKTWKRPIGNSLWVAITISFVLLFSENNQKLIHTAKNLSHRCTESDAYNNNMSVSPLHQTLERSGSEKEIR